MPRPCSARLPVHQMLANPRWLSAAIHNCPHVNNILINDVKNGEWKSLGQCSVILAVGLRMNPSKNLQAFNIRIETDEEVVAEPRFFVLIKVIPLNEIVPSKLENLKLHRTSSEICFLASSQSMDLASPLAISRSRSSRRSFCH